MRTRPASGEAKSPFGPLPLTQQALAGRASPPLPALAPAAPTWTHQAIWMLIGLACGLALVVPTVLWLTPAGSSRQPTVTARPPAVLSSTFGASTPAPVLVQPPQPVVRPPVAERGPDAATIARDNLIDKARDLIQARAIAKARTTLQAPPLAQDGLALYLLAGTYDPNLLAAMGVMDVRAEPERARFLYERALAAGHGEAKARLEQLR